MFSIGSFILGGAAAIVGLSLTIYLGSLVETGIQRWRLFRDRLDSLQSNDHRLGEDVHKLHTQLMKATNELEQLKRHVLSQGKEDSK